jgi:hypothetical protein
MTCPFCASSDIADLMDDRRECLDCGKDWVIGGKKKRRRRHGNPRSLRR